MPILLSESGGLPMVRPSNSNLCATLAFSVLIAGMTGPATAQESEQPAARGGAVEEVVVTARRREESQRDIPTSIDAFTGSRLAELGYSTVEDVLKLSPGVTFEAGFSPSSTSIILRGITNDSRG